MLSIREIIANQIYQFVRENELTSPYCECGKSPDNKYRFVLFSSPINLDGVVRVYSPKYIIVQYQTRYLSLPAKDSRVFECVEHAIKFLDLAFVQIEGELALEVPTK